MVKILSMSEAKEKDSHATVTQPADIFVSYAHVDNAILTGNKGWITSLVENLRKLVSRKMGREENYRLWMDFRLKGSDAITPEIETQIQNARTLVICLSPGWLKSEWCRKELELFCASKDDLKHRIFVVELDVLNQKNTPETLHDLLGYRFWWKNEQDRIRQLGFPLPNGNDQEYFDRLSDLSADLANAIKTSQSDNSQPVTAPKATIYIAPVSDALYSQREILINGLKQYGIAAVPRSNTLDNDIEDNLAACSHFVQLLDADSMLGIPVQRFEVAQSAGKPILQWREKTLDYTGEHINEEHRQLLDDKTVIATPLPDFIRIVHETVLPKPKEKEDKKPPVNEGNKTIFVHAGLEDYERALSVTKLLRGKGYGIVLSRCQGAPKHIRQSIERGFKYCDVVLVLQQIVPAIVIEKFLEKAQDYSQRRETKPSVLICHDKDAEILTFFPAGVQTLECHTNFHEHCLEQFLAKMEP